MGSVSPAVLKLIDRQNAEELEDQDGEEGEKEEEEADEVVENSEEGGEEEDVDMQVTRSEGEYREARSARIWGWFNQDR